MLVYLKQPSLYKLKRFQTVERRRNVLENKMFGNTNMIVQKQNADYSDAFEIILKDK